MQARLFHLHALSALHCGTGQSGGVVDLPIARARSTQLPIVPGSSLRGVLRHYLTGHDKELARTLFGPTNIDRDAFAGALSIGDAHLLALPVRCLAGIVSYVTCPFILQRYAGDLNRAGAAPTPPLPEETRKDRACIAPASVNTVQDKLVLEDLDLPVSRVFSLERWARRIARDVHPDDDDAQADIVHRFALVPDDVMSFLAETATEFRARIRLDPESGTVSKGALWYEEHLPAETLLWGVFALSRSNNDGDSRTAEQLAQALPKDRLLLQLGGHAGVGHGLVRFRPAGAAA